MAMSVSGGSLEFVAAINDSDFGKSILRMEEQLRGLTRTAETESSAIDNFASKAALALGGFFSLTAGSNLLNQIVNVRGEFQKLEAVLTNSLGSQDMAKSALGMIAHYAATTPFQLDEVANAYVKLVNQGFKPTKEELTSLGDLAASTGKSFDQVTEAILDAQTNQFERLKEFGIIASKQGDQVKFTFKGVETTVNDTSESIKNYIVGLGQLQGVAGSTAAISGTLVGQVSNLRDAFDKMLNELGQGSEGAISSAISGVSYLVDHYQSVIDIIKVLGATYGTYKAALIVTTALQSGLTAAELLHYAALEIARKAQLLLNATMLANPYALAAAAIIGVVSSLALFSKEASNVKSKVDLLADAQKHVTDNLAETQAKFTPYLEALKKTNLTEGDRLSIYEKIRAVDPEILKGIDAKTLSYDKLKVNVDNYIGSLKKQIDLEANKGALTASIQQENELERQIKVAERQAGEIAKLRNTATGNLAGVGLTGANQNAVSDNLNRLKSDLKAQQDVSKELANGQIEIEKTLSSGSTNKDAAGKRTVAIIDAEIKSQKELQSQQSATSKEYLDFQTKINALEAERTRIVGQSKAEVKSQQAEENKLNAILQQRNSILNELAALHRDASQSGLTKEASEVDKINEKYDLAIKKIQEFNAAHPKQQISAAEIQAVGSDRATEVNNAILKQQADDYKKSLDVQKDIFSQYEQAKKDIGIQKANEMFAGQTKGFSNYIAFLLAERQKITANIDQTGIDVGIDLKLKANSEQLVQAEKDAAQAAYTNYVALVQATQSTADKRLEIETKYQKDVADIQAKFKGDDQTTRLAILKDAHQRELTDLDDNLARQGALYQQLNVDVIRYTRDQLQERLNLLKKYLSDGYLLEKDGSKTAITPQMKADLEQGIKQAQDFLSSTNEVLGVSVEQLQEFAKYADVAGQSFHSLASAISPLNAGLGDTLETIGQLSDLAGNAAKSVAGFASGDIVGGVQGAVSAITGLIKIFSASHESAVKAAAELKTYQDSLITGEITYNELLRDRQRTQSDLTTLTIAELAARKEMLKTQQQQAQADYNSLLAQIQASGQQITGEHTERYGGFLGIGRKTRVVQDLAGLSDADYDQLNQLFTEGKLTGETKTWFEALQKVHDELDTIGLSAKEAADQINQEATGTTSSSILDGIVQGFADGKKVSADFASNFQDLMKQSLISSFKYSPALKAAIDKFYAQFAEDAASGGSLDTGEISDLQKQYNQIIADQAQQFADLQKITNINLDAAGNATNGASSLQGAIKAASQQSIDLLAGTMGGLRLTALETLDVSNKQLLIQSKIEFNTASAVQIMSDYYRNWTVNGLKVSL